LFILFSKGCSTSSHLTTIIPIMSTRSESPETSKPISSQTKHHGSGRCWTKEETALLEKHREEYKEAGDTARGNIVSEVLQEMLDIVHNGKLFKKEERTALKKVRAYSLDIH
jgi:hypothetical protein